LQSSFGFGQVGGTVLVLNPRYLLGALEPLVYEAYKIRTRTRALSSYKVMSEMMITNSLVRIKDAPPYAPELEAPVLLNSMARATFDAKTNTYAFTSKLDVKPTLDIANAKAMAEILADDGSISGVGVDQGEFLEDGHDRLLIMTTELISAVPSWNPTFVERNFTEAETSYCRSQPAPAASFAARWAGKEAVFKALGVSSRGAAAPMKDIEILPSSTGAPAVTLHGEAKSAASAKGISKIHISLSHSETVAIAFAQASSA
jgi:fatty acid synthase subunit alpha